MSARPHTTSNIDLDRLKERLAAGGGKVLDFILDVGFDVFDGVLVLAIPGIVALTGLNLTIEGLYVLRECQNFSALKPCSSRVSRISATKSSAYLAKNVPKLCDAFTLLVHVTRSPDARVSGLNVQCGILRGDLVFLGDSPLLRALRNMNFCRVAPCVSFRERDRDT